jgi:hypothetical protein
MSVVYVGLDLGSSSFHQVAITSAGTATVNRSFSTSELNLKKAFADCSAAMCLRPTRRAAPQPANLPSMVDFMPKDMKPLEVIVHLLPAAKGCLLFEPPVLTTREFI